jgi:hypothetical protein
MGNDQLWQAIRYGLIFVGGILATKGYLDKSAVPALASRIIEALTQTAAAVGLIMSVGSTLWGFYVTWKTKRVPLATAQRPDVPTIHPATGAIEPPGAVR